MEPALASAPGSGVTEPSATSDTRSDTKTPPVDVPSATSATTSFVPADNSIPLSSPSAHPLQIEKEPHPPSPKSSPAHARSQTVDVLPGSSSVSGSVASPSGSVQSPIRGPIKRKPLSSSASALALRYSASGSPLPSPLDLGKPSQRFARPCSVDSPTLYEFSPAQRAAQPAVP